MSNRKENFSNIVTSMLIGNVIFFSLKVGDIISGFSKRCDVLMECLGMIYCEVILLLCSKSLVCIGEALYNFDGAFILIYSVGLKLL